MELSGSWRNLDGSVGKFFRELKSPPYETEVSGIGASSGFWFGCYLVLKSGQRIQGVINDGVEGIMGTRVHPRTPRHVLKVSSPVEPILVSTPVNLDLQVDDTGMRVRTVLFKRDGEVIGEDSTAPYGMRWTNAIPGYSNLSAEVFYFELEPHMGFSSPLVGINHIRRPVQVSTEVQGVSSGRVTLRGLVANSEGLKVSKVQFLEGSKVIAEDTEFPYEMPWQTTPGRVCEISCRVIFSTGHVLEATPIRATIPSPDSGPTLELRPPPSAGSLIAPATVELQAVVNANGSVIQKVQFLANGMMLGEDSVAPYVLAWTKVTAGTRDVVARVLYGSNQAVDSAALSVVVRNPAPTVTVGAGTPPAGGWVAPVTIPLSATVDARGNTIAKVQFLADGALVGRTRQYPTSCLGRMCLPGRKIWSHGWSTKRTKQWIPQP